MDKGFPAAWGCQSADQETASKCASWCYPRGEEGAKDSQPSSCTHDQETEAEILPLRKESPAERGLGCPWAGLGRALSAGCHGSQRSSAKWLLLQKLVSERRGLPGASEPFPTETKLYMRGAVPSHASSSRLQRSCDGSAAFWRGRGRRLGMGAPEQRSHGKISPLPSLCLCLCLSPLTHTSTHTELG